MAFCIQSICKQSTDSRFQESLYRWVRGLWFEVSSFDDEGGPEAAGLVGALKGAMSRMIYDISEALHGSPILGNEAWLRLALPD